MSAKTAALLLPLLSLGLGHPTGADTWRPILPARLESSAVHKAHNSDYRFSLHEDNSDLSSPQHAQLLQPDARDQCSLYKVVVEQKLYFEYIHYKIDIPDLREFTLCMWTKFTNHTNDHPLFSYAVGDQARGILSWVANTPRSSYYMMNIDGHNLYRLNYPLRLNRWYHSCQSWNGRTGEWQIWVNNERVGRGFNNRLVGHIIKGGGLAISGQEQRQLGGGFLEGNEAPPGSGGMLGELTMVQLYGVALSAGKAHRDHKHHHAHHFEHDMSNNVPPTTTMQTPIIGSLLSMSPFLTAGQLNHQVKINPGAHLQVVQNGVTLRHPSLPAAPALPPQPLPPAIAMAPTTKPFLAEPAFPYDFTKLLLGISGRPGRQPHLQRFLPTVAPDEVQRIIGDMELRRTTKRHILTNETHLQMIEFTDVKPTDHEIKTNWKRDLVMGSLSGLLLDETLVQQTDLVEPAGLAGFGLMPLLRSKHQDKEVKREPAETEVRRVMELCDGCAEEPFERALVMAWRSVPKKLYSGALHIPAVPACKAF